MFRPPFTPVVVAATLLAVLLSGLLVGCTGEDGPAAPDGEDSRQQRTSEAAPQLPTTTTVGQVVGKLGKQQRQQLKARVTEVVDGWIDAAYVSGPYPRRRFEHSFPGFSAGAKDEARRDAGLMSNAAVGDWVQSVEAVARRLKLDVLATRGRAVGVTARVLLRIELRGRRLERIDRIAGRLFLTYRNQDWQVFGYDVTRAEV